MNETTIEIGPKANGIAKGVFIDMVQKVAQDIVTNSHLPDHRASKSFQSLTGADIQAIREFTQSHYTNHIRQLLTHNSNPLPETLDEFKRLPLGQCKLNPEEYASHTIKEHGYYEVFGHETIRSLKTFMQDNYKADPYDRVIQELGIKATGSLRTVGPLKRLITFLKQCKENPTLSSYYSNIIGILKESRGEDVYVTNAVNEIKRDIKNKDLVGVDLLYIFEIFFTQCGDQGGVKLKELLEAFHGKKNEDLICFITTFNGYAEQKQLASSKEQTRVLFTRIAKIHDLKKLQSLYAAAIQKRACWQLRDILEGNKGYESGIDYLNTFSSETLLAQIQAETLVDSYVASQSM